MRIKDEDAFRVGDVVETDYSGKTTRHCITARLKVRNSQSGVMYELTPKVPKSFDKNHQHPRLDHAWLRLVHRLDTDAA